MKKIVLIEDDADLLSLLKYNLEKEGFALTVALTGKGALDLCRRVRPDLILLDVMLPDSDGLDICKGVRNDTELSRIPQSIFLTAQSFGNRPHCGAGTRGKRLHCEALSSSVS